MTPRPAKASGRSRRVAGSRNSREHLLDVRVRQSTARRQRNHRALHFVFGLLLWGGTAAGAIYGFHAITQKFFLQNPEYNLRVIDAHLDDLMTKDEALRISDLQLGKNIFRLDLGAAERAFRRIDQIATISIQRDWPDTVRIKLTKRVPVAWLARSGENLSADNALLIDATGSAMKPYRIEPEYWRLPVIIAPDPELILSGDALAFADLKAALALLDARAQRPQSLLNIRSIDITKAYAFEVTDAGKAKLVFSPQDPGAQLDRVQKLLENCRETGRQLDSVNLIPKKYTPVRFLLASTILESPPITLPTKSNRKTRN